jgi:MFS family permease
VNDSYGAEVTIQPSPTKNQVRGFWAAWGGLALDGMDSFIYALVLMPAMRELLPASGISPTAGNLALYGSVLFSAFLVGWGCAFLWGPVSDRFGRVHTLMLAILCYALFTFLGCVAHTVWELGIFRLLAGFGVGGEFVGTAIFVAEEMPDHRRVHSAGLLNSAYYVGALIAAALSYLVGANYGWRAMFVLGGLPALFIAYVRLGVHEPERWRKRIKDIGGASALLSFVSLFRPEYRRRTVVNCLLLLISMIGLWAGSVYVPSAVTQVALRDGYSAADSVRWASWATILLACGTILGCLLAPAAVDRFGRRGALASYFALMCVSIAFAFGYAFYLQQYALTTFISALFLVGVGGGSFAIYMIWIPEQYRSESRGSAFALATCIGRFVAAATTFVVGAGVSSYGSIGVPIALTSVVFAAGLFVIPFSIETRGQPLPA